MTTNTTKSLDPTTEQQQNIEVVDDFYFHAVDYIYKKRKFFITLAVITVVAILLAYGAIRYKASVDVERAENFYKIEKQFKANEQNAEAIANKILPLYTSFINANQGTVDEAHALFQRSNMYLQIGKLGEAETDLRNLVSKTELPSDLNLLSAMFLANTLRDQKKGKEAASILEDVLRQRPSDTIQIELAEVYFSLNDKVKAQQTLNELLGSYPNSLYKDRAEKLLAALK